MKRTLLFLCFITSIAISAQKTTTSLKDGNWEDATLWDNGLPVNGDNVVIANGHDVVVNSGTVITLNNVTIGGTGSQIDQQPGSAVTITGTLTATRSTDHYQFSGGSNGDDIGTLILSGTDASGKRMRIVKKVATANTWYLMSFGTRETRVNEILPGNFAESTTTGNEGNYSLAYYDGSQAVNSKYIYPYNSGDAAYANSVQLENGRGYSIKTKAGQTNIISRAKFQTSDVSINISDAGDQFNLVGNPYPSYLHGNDNADGTNNILRINGVNGSQVLDEDTIWLWDAANTTFVTKNLSDPTFRINPMQGFFVKAKSGGGTAQSFSFTESMQSHTKADNNLKSANSRLEVNLIVSSNKINRKTSVRYIDGTSTDFDNGYDSSTFGGYALDFEIYSELVGGSSTKKLAIQSLPTDYEELIVPVGIKVSEEKEYAISAEVNNLPSGIEVYLEDRQTNSFTRLDQVGQNYKVTLSGDTKGRFFLHTRSSALGLDSEILNSVKVYKNGESQLRIAGLSKGKASIKLLNVLGAEVLSKSFVASNVNDIDLPKVNSGVYIIQIETESGSLNKKIVLE